jgi:hypothetical protein
MITELLNNGYFLDNQWMKNQQDWIDYCSEKATLRTYQNFWSMDPESDGKIMLLSSEKINDKDCFVSRPILLDWHYDGMGCIGREDLIFLYCITPNSVTSVVNLQQMYEDAPAEIKQIVNRAVIELEPDNEIYDTTKREKVAVIRTNSEFEKEAFKPMLQTHKMSNRHGLLYSPTFVRQIHGATKQEIDAFKSYYQDTFNDYVYNHTWQENDILVIDQTVSIHCRHPFEGQRKLWRTSGWYKID